MYKKTQVVFFVFHFYVDMHSLGKNIKLHEMKNEKIYMGFLIHKIEQILKRFSRAFRWAQTSYFWRVHPELRLTSQVLTVVGCDVIITAGELGVDELQLDVFEDEFGNGWMVETEPAVAELRRFGEGVLIWSWLK